MSCKQTLTTSFYYMHNTLSETAIKRSEYKKMFIPHISLVMTYFQFTIVPSHNNKNNPKYLFSVLWNFHREFSFLPLYHPMPKKKIVKRRRKKNILTVQLFRFISFLIFSSRIAVSFFFFSSSEYLMSTIWHSFCVHHRHVYWKRELLMC